MDGLIVGSMVGVNDGDTLGVTDGLVLGGCDGVVLGNCVGEHVTSQHVLSHRTIPGEQHSPN